MNQTTLPTKDIALIKTQTSKALAVAGALEIKNPEGEAKAVELVKKIKTVGQIITDKKKSIVDPLNEALRNAHLFFAPFEQQCAKAEQTIKYKLLIFRAEQEERAIKRVEKIVAKVETGKMDFKTAEPKIAATELSKTIGTPQASVQYRTVKDVVIEDEAKIPREYLVLNMVKIRADALAGKIIAGVEVVEKQIVAIR